MYPTQLQARSFVWFFQVRSLKARVTLLSLLVFLIGLGSLALFANQTLTDNSLRMLGGQQFVSMVDEIPMTLIGISVRLQQAVLNFVNRAVKFTPSGGVCLSVALLSQDESNAMLRCEFSDSGIGIAPDALSLLLSKFEQADMSTTRRYGGTGLGLSITRNIAQLMGGMAGGESTLGVGSAFWFTAQLQKSIPVEHGGNPIPVDAAESTLLADIADTRVLVAEDEPINAEIASIMLRSVGFVVDVAEDRVQAVLQASAHSYQPILMDMQMPNMDGLEATKKNRALPGFAETPIIAMTVNSFIHDRQRRLEAGMNTDIFKPNPSEELYSALLHYLSVELASEGAHLNATNL